MDVGGAGTVGGGPAHVPFFKQLPYKRNGDRAEATDPAHHSPKVRAAAAIF